MVYNIAHRDHKKGILLMRIVLIAQAAFGEKVLEAIIKMGEEVVGVYTPPDKVVKNNPLKQLADSSGIGVFQPEYMKSSEVYYDYVKLKADLNVMAFVTSIIPESILEYPPLGTIQYHPSLLPRHCGGSAINWAIINGEAKTGITIFWPDKGIDTGPILLQKEAEIAPDDTVGSLYFNKLFPIGVEVIIESIELIKKGSAPRIPQDESEATYEKLCTEEDSVINWNKPAVTVYNLIRGTDPQPGAITYFNGKRLKVFDSELGTANSGNYRAGTIIDIEQEGFRVAARGGTILIKRVQPVGSSKIKANEFIDLVNLKCGDVFGV